MAAPRGRKRAITPATVAMGFIVMSFLVALVATRFGMDIVGPHIVDAMEWVHDKTGWYEGARAADARPR